MNTFEIDHIIDLLDIGREYISDSLIRHDVELGRTTEKNQNTARMMQKHLAQFDNKIKQLMSINARL